MISAMCEGDYGVRGGGSCSVEEDGEEEEGQEGEKRQKECITRTSMQERELWLLMKGGSPSYQETVEEESVDTR